MKTKLLENIKIILEYADKNQIKIISESDDNGITMINFNVAGMKIGLSKLNLSINGEKFSFDDLGDTPEKYKLLFLFMKTKTDTRKAKELEGYTVMAKIMEPVK